MKKFFAMAVALIAAVTVQAQDLTDNYQKIYAGFSSGKTFDAEIDAYKGFNVGYAYAFNITGHNVPLFLEVGAEYSYMSTTLKSDLGDAKWKDHSLQIPLNITYKFGNENFSVAPFIGEAIKFHLSNKIEDQSVFEDSDYNRVQAYLNLGVNFVIARHWQIGYRYQLSETKFEAEKTLTVGGVTVKNDPKNDYTNNITIGYVF